MHTKEILRELIALPTISSNPNRELIDRCAGLLRDAGAEVVLLEADSGQKANLYATIGPRDRPGVLLSGHTDVVPVDGQDWSVPPFEMTEHEGKLYGRGTADMKGFVASALVAALAASRRHLQTPLHLAFSYDEEIGCVGVRSLVEMLAKAPFRPRMCIVGEPTSMDVATGHKGKAALHARFRGREAHSALAPTGLNAIHLACDFVASLRELQSEIEREGPRDDDYDVPYSTVHVGRIEGGIALNIVPNTASVQFEIRHLAADDPAAIIERIKTRAAAIVASHTTQFPEADIAIEITNTYPGLDTPLGAEVVSFVKALTRGNATKKVAFGTEGGLFDTELGIPTVVCGPGSMEQGHKPDEFVSERQLAQCDTMLATLIDRLELNLFQTRVDET